MLRTLQQLSCGALRPLLQVGGGRSTAPPSRGVQPPPPLHLPQLPDRRTVMTLHHYIPPASLQGTQAPLALATGRAFSAAAAEAATAATNGGTDGAVQRGADGLILPHGGGRLADLMVSGAAAEAAKARCNYRLELTERQVRALASPAVLCCAVLGSISGACAQRRLGRAGAQVLRSPCMRPASCPPATAGSHASSPPPEPTHRPTAATAGLRRGAAVCGRLHPAGGIHERRCLPLSGGRHEVRCRGRPL